MKKTTLLIALTLSQLACAAETYVDGERLDGTTITRPSDDLDGESCAFQHGTATLVDYDGENPGAAGYNFELASQDPEFTRNRFDLLYEGNRFRVNLVVDDQSTIVDLGDVELLDLPVEADIDDALHHADEHDAILAHLGHTYVVHRENYTGRLVAAFRVLGIDPGRQVRIEWVRSTSDRDMVLPENCL